MYTCLLSVFPSEIASIGNMLLSLVWQQTPSILLLLHIIEENKKIIVLEADNHSDDTIAQIN